LAGGLDRRGRRGWCWATRWMQTYRPHQRDAHAAVSSATLYPRTRLQNHQQPRGAEHADEPMAVRETHHLVRSRLLGIDNDRVRRPQRWPHAERGPGLRCISGRRMKLKRTVWTQPPPNRIPQHFVDWRQQVPVGDSAGRPSPTAHSGQGWAWPALGSTPYLAPN